MINYKCSRITDKAFNLGLQTQVLILYYLLKDKSWLFISGKVIGLQIVFMAWSFIMPQVAGTKNDMSELYDQPKN